WLGAEGDLLHPSERNARRIKLYTPVLSNEQFYALKTLVHPDIKSQNIRTLFSDDLEKGLKDLFQQAEKAIKEGVSLLILSDRA
ncbi:glutamate synthase central domain-containing protein, partial [Streptococcus sobrinus]